MALSMNEIKGLLRLIGLTQDSEINCEQCLALVSEFAERKLEGQTIPDALLAVEQHLSICAECQEEFEALQQALGGFDESSED